MAKIGDPTDDNVPTVTTDNTDKAVPVHLNCGIDIGHFDSVVTTALSSKPFSIELEPNRLANRSTPTVVAYDARLRLVGEAAEDKAASLPSAVITNFLALADVTTADQLNEVNERMHWRLRNCGHMKSEGDDDTAPEPIWNVAFNDEQIQVTLREVVSVYVREVLKFVVRNKQEANLCFTDSSAINTKLSVAVPGYFSPIGRKQFSDACMLAGVDDVTLISQNDAFLASWLFRNKSQIANRDLSLAAGVIIPPPHTANTTGSIHSPPSVLTDTTAGDSSSSVEGFSSLVVGFLDIGFGHYSIDFVKVTPPPPFGDGCTGPQTDIGAAANQQQVDSSASEPTVDILTRITDRGLGVVDFLNVIFGAAEEVLQKDFTKYCQSGCYGLTPKQRWRLGNASTKLLKDLSVLPSSSLELDAFLSDDHDFHMTMTREDFERRCRGLQTRLHEAMAKSIGVAVERVGFDFTKTITSASSPPAGTDRSMSEDSEAAPDVHMKIGPCLFIGIELLGGGTRVPWVQDVVGRQFSIPNAQSSLLRRTLDSSAAIAVGANLHIASAPYNPMPYDAADFEELRGVLSRQEAIEAAETVRLEKFNELETFIISIRRATVTRADLFGGVVEELNQKLQLADEWIIDHDAATSDTQTYEEKLRELKESVEPLCAHYFETVEAEAKRADAEIENAAKENRTLGGEADDVAAHEDRDNRKLPNSQRLNLASKNKNEGNELLKGGMLELATQRYLKALSHLSKPFVNETPAEIEERRVLNLALHSNLAQVYFRVNSADGFKKCIHSCTSALEFDNKNVKVLYRRAMANEKLKQYDEAFADLNAANTEDCEHAEVQKSLERVKKYIRLEESRRKNMYARMMGTKTD